MLKVTIIIIIVIIIINILVVISFMQGTYNSWHT